MWSSGLCLKKSRTCWRLNSMFSINILIHNVSLNGFSTPEFVPLLIAANTHGRQIEYQDLVLKKEEAIDVRTLYLVLPLSVSYKRCSNIINMTLFKTAASSQLRFSLLSFIRSFVTLHIKEMLHFVRILPLFEVLALYFSLISFSFV